MYEQNRDGTRGRLVEEDAYAHMLNRLRDDAELFSIEAFHLRAQYPTLQKAYEQYKTVYKLVCDNDTAE